jgi:hypothetical protein
VVSPGQWPPITFAPTRNQRLGQKVAGIVFAVSGIGPDFDDQLATIQSYWSAHATPSQHRRP